MLLHFIVEWMESVVCCEEDSLLEHNQVAETERGRGKRGVNAGSATRQPPLRLTYILFSTSNLVNVLSYHSQVERS